MFRALMSGHPRFIGWKAILGVGWLLFFQSAFVCRPATPEREASTYNPHLTFDVASIRESRDGNMSYFDNSPHNSLFHAERVAPIGLIFAAYDLHVAGLLEQLPAWAVATRFTITAKSDASTDEILAKLNDSDASAEKRRMLQLLLSERFHLRIHPEARMSKTYQLSATARTTSLMSPVRGDLRNTVSSCSQHFHSGKGVEINSTGCPFSILFSVLQQALGTDIVDHTGLKGEYAFHLTWMPTQLLTQGDVDRYPRIEEAVNEQLGLELKQTKATVTYWVVDHIERPTPN